MQALKLCEENEFYLSNQKETLKRLEAENQKHRQEMAKQKLIEKSNQFKTKQKENEQPKPASNNERSSKNDEQILHRESLSKNSPASEVQAKQTNDSRESEITAKNGLLFKNIQSKLNEHAQSSKVSKLPSTTENLVCAKSENIETMPESSESSISQALYSRNLDYDRPNSSEISVYTMNDERIERNNRQEGEIPQADSEQSVRSRLPFEMTGHLKSGADLQPGNENGSVSTSVPFYAAGSNKKVSGTSSQRDLKSQPRPASTQFINYSEFEDNTTPFDTVAIQSVNDLKELEQIFMTKSASGQSNAYQNHQTVFSQVGPNNHSANQPNQIYANPLSVTQTSVALSGYTTLGSNYYSPADTKSGPISQTGTAPNSFSMQNAANINTNAEFANQTNLSKRSSVPVIYHDSYLKSNLTQQGISHHFPAGQRNVNGLNFDISTENKNPQLSTTTANFQSSTFSAYLPLTRHFTPSQPSSDQSMLNYQRFQNTSTSNQIAASGATGNPIQIPFTATHHDASVGSNPNGTNAFNQVADSFGNHVISGPRSLSPRMDNPLDPNKSTQNSLSNSQYVPNGAMRSNLLTNSNQLSIGTTQPMSAQMSYNDNNKVKMAKNDNNTADHSYYSSLGSSGTGMKPAKSLGDLTSCVPAASLSEERKPDFNVYLPMSSYLAMKK